TEAETHDPAHAAWHLHWVGVAYLLATQEEDANGFFWQASNKKLALGRLSSSATSNQMKIIPPGPQAIRVAELLNNNYKKCVDSILTLLNGGGGKNAEEHEEGLRLLGEKLGFIATRPDADAGKGPDVAWSLPEAKVVVAFEAKTQKESPKVYKKNKHIGKVLNDCIWLEENFKSYERRLFLLGPEVGIAPQASPPPDLRVVELSQFIGLTERLVSAALHIVARIDSKTPSQQAVQNGFLHYGLLWPECVDSFDYTLAADLQVDTDAND
ncbi:MAG TPA: hypothetical protein VFY06_07300, partial [Verrucomicrobiae bacterium]|nr:hypothetical protein [Verrucomicrobiae bacterium]